VNRRLARSETPRQTASIISRGEKGWTTRMTKSLTMPPLRAARHAYHRLGVLSNAYALSPSTECYGCAVGRTSAYRRLRCLRISFANSMPRILPTPLLRGTVAGILRTLAARDVALRATERAWNRRKTYFNVRAKRTHIRLRAPPVAHVCSRLLRYANAPVCGRGK